MSPESRSTSSPTRPSRSRARSVAPTTMLQLRSSETDAAVACRSASAATSRPAAARRGSSRSRPAETGGKDCRIGGPGLSGRCAHHVAQSAQRLARRVDRQPSEAVRPASGRWRARAPRSAGSAAPQTARATASPSSATREAAAPPPRIRTTTSGFCPPIGSAARRSASTRPAAAPLPSNGVGIERTMIKPAAAHRARSAATSEKPAAAGGCTRTTRVTSRCQAPR